MADRMMLVSAGIIWKDGKVLLAQREEKDGIEPGRWEFPGGKVELFEHPQETLVREVKEELGIDIAAGELFIAVSHVYHKGADKLHVVMMVYEAEWKAGEVVFLEAQDARWLPLAELKDYPLVSADVAVVEQLVRKKG